MSRKNPGIHFTLNAASYRITCVVLAVVTILLLASANAVATPVAASDDSRSSVSLHVKDGVRGKDRNQAQGTETIDRYDSLRTSGKRGATVSQPASQSTSTKDSGTQAATLAANDFWIYDADVVLFYDDDGDGYYYGIDLLFDADTIYSVADVYAVVYLSFEGGPWNEYASSNDFTIYGTSPGDDYVLITELMSGYPSGDYDLLIELFDAIDGSFLASFGPDDSSELSFLSLEDFNRDAPGFDRPVTVSRGGGGTIGLWLLAALAAVLRRRKGAASPLFRGQFA